MRKLREEAAELRKRLEEAEGRGSAGAAGAADDGVYRRSGPRTEGSGTREGMFGGKGNMDWGLSEGELDAKLSEVGLDRASEAAVREIAEKFEGMKGDGQRVKDGEGGVDGDVMRRNFLIGFGLVAVTGAAALVPTDPQGGGELARPLFFYLVPVVRARRAIPAMKQMAADGDWAALREAAQGLVKRDGGDGLLPSMEAAARSLEKGGDATRALELSFRVREYVLQSDYRVYFDSPVQPVGKAALEFQGFSEKALSAADEAMGAFLGMMDQEQVQAALSQVAAFD